MRRKNLLTSVLCAVLLMASCAVSNYHDSSILKRNRVYQVHAAEAAEKDSADEKKQKAAEVKSKTPETSETVKIAEAPKAGEAVKTPETAKQTEAASSESPKQTEAASSESPKQTEAAPPEETKPTEAAPSEETKPTEAAPSEETKPTEAAPSEETKPTETVPSEETKPTETVPQEPAESTPGTEQLPSETVPDTEQDATENTSGTEQLPLETEVLTETSDSETESETSSRTEEEKESETSEFDNNEDLIAHQNIVIPPDIEREFRFTQVEKAYAIVSVREGTAVYEEKSEDSREIGALEYYGCCCILEDKKDGWYYVESGNVRGFVNAKTVVAGEAAERIAAVRGLERLPEARLLVARTENEAFEYTHTTAQQVVADKVYALADGRVSIYEQRKDSARETGILADKALCYILADEEASWVFAESGNARGFIKKEDLITGTEAEQKVAECGENNLSRAEVLVEPQDNKSCYYTLTSVQKASQAAKTREAMVKFALQFVGSPYVWGGTSLTNGADCSGFVQSVYSYFGYSIPRVAEDQSRYGMQIPIDSAEPGDLIFYARNGYVYHVSMCIGKGQVVQAANRNAGIITSGIGGDAVWATRIITD